MSEVFRLRRDARYRLVDGEAVVLLQDTGETLVLDEVGAAVLGHFDGARDLDAVISSLLDDFDGEPERVRTEVATFAAELVEVGVLEPVSAPVGDPVGAHSEGTSSNDS